MDFSKDFDCIPKDCVDQHLPMTPSYATVFGKYGIRGVGFHEVIQPYEIMRTPVEWHLVLITFKGKAEWQTKKGKGILERGDIWIVPHKTAHHYKASEDWGFISIALLPMNNFAHLEREIDTKKFLENLDHLINGVQSYLYESRFSEQDRYEIASSLAQYITHVIMRELKPLENYEANRSRLKLRELWEDVNANPKEHWVIPKLAERLFISTRQFQRMMKEHYEVTAEQMLMRIRMDKAKELIASSDYTMARIAENIGYESVFSFSKAFKRYFQTTPGAYAKEVSKASIKQKSS